MPMRIRPRSLFCGLVLRVAGQAVRPTRHFVLLVWPGRVVKQDASGGTSPHRLHYQGVGPVYAISLQTIEVATGCFPGLAKATLTKRIAATSTRRETRRPKRAQRVPSTGLRFLAFRS